MMKAMMGIIYKTSAEEFFVNLRRKVNIIRKFIPVSVRHKFPSIGRMIPGSSTYPKTDCYQLTRDNTHFKINRSDYVQWRLFYGVRDNALKEAKKSLQPDSIVLDIGSNFGAFSLKLARWIADTNSISNISIHAFEPNPLAIENFNENLALNKGLEKLVTLHHFALGNMEQNLLFDFPESNSGAGRILSNGLKGQFEVPVKKLDDFVGQLNPGKIAFIKLIAEGFEPKIIEGGWQIITKYKPPIFFEVTEKWWAENDRSVLSVLNELQSLGYSFMIEQFNEMIPFNWNKHSLRTQYNLFATAGPSRLM
jgi:FkbM family methyltransferase